MSKQSQTTERYRIENLTFTYPERGTPALAGIDTVVRRGDFLALCGASGCGKTTLLRQLKPILAPHGARSGEIFFDGRPLSALDLREQSAKIGFVMQSPENQIVTDKVWHELAFGPESQGAPQAEIRLRVAEMASFFGIQTWFYKNVTELSGGQKQLLNLASVMTMQPEVLLLDEPTSRLDPIAASEFLTVVGKINRELGVTVIISEHRPEDVFPLCDRVAVMDEGRIIAEGSPSDVGAALKAQGHGMFYAMPAPMRIWAALPQDVAGKNCPVTVRDGRDWLDRLACDAPIEDAESKTAPQGDPAVELNDVWFRYEKNAPDVIKGLSFKAYSGMITAVLGGNATGKTTALSLISGVNKPYRGKVKIDGEPIEKLSGRLFSNLLGVLPQNPQTIFVRKTVKEDLYEILSGAALSKEEKRSMIARAAALCRLDGLMDSHPYDLSGGEQQRAALAKTLLLRPRILLLDEPTKGLDAEFKRVFAGILKGLAAAGVAIVIVSHDIDFCAEYADSCALFFDGAIVTEGQPRDFFSGNSFYTTAANRMARDRLPRAVTPADVIEALGGSAAELYYAPPETDIDALIYGRENGETPVQRPDGDRTEDSPPAPNGVRLFAGVSAARKIAAAVSTLCLVCTLIFAGMNAEGLSAFVSGGDLAVSAANNAGAWKYVGVMLVIAAEAAALAISLSRKREDSRFRSQINPEERKLRKRTVAAAAMILIAVPLTIYVGVYFLGDRKYYFISMLILLETMLPFALAFESRKPQARELVIIAVLCAISVAGRAAFFMLPQFKPVLALVIIAGVAFGGESGFLVGAITGLVSNIFLGQGPWTPWQMFSFGLIGFLAGVLFRKGLIGRSRASLCVFGALAALAVYGPIMDSSMVLMYQIRPTRLMFLAAFLQGIPFNLVHATATVVFLLIISRPMLEKLDRIKVKYGLME
ncbi:MAG: ATP-binding cassette domain-containing protein [Clostridiales Family XIII bacterium]|nr:ATP-binding cassette domain-containing protein [Clostridiales Family XIII bacterium]